MTSSVECRKRNLLNSQTESTADETNIDSPTAATVPYSATAAVENTNWSLRKLWLIDEVPMIFQEPFIVSHYRPPKCSFSECLVGMMWPMHNETWNVWTHFIHGLYFAWLLFHLLFHENSSFFLTSSIGIPMVIYLATAASLGLMSAAAHLFNTLSMNARHIAFTFDYLAISLFSYGCAGGYRAYSFPRDGESRDEDDDFQIMGYLPIALFLAATSHLVACYTRLASDPIPIVIHSGRFFAYVVPYFFVTWPCQYRVFMWYFYGDPLDFGVAGITWHGIHFIFALGAVFFYLSHVPERFAPGIFDVFGHSHQFFHLFSTTATFLQFFGFLEDFKYKNCVHNEFHANTTNMWPCEPGSGFSTHDLNTSSSSFLSTSVFGLIVHNVLACSLLAAFVVPRVIEIQHHHHHRHRHTPAPRHHSQKIMAKIITPSLLNKTMAFIKELKMRIVRIGSFRHRL